MRQVAVAFATTGSSPRAGHRFSEIVLVGQEGGLPTGQPVRFELGSELRPNEATTFPAVLEEIIAFVGDAQLIVHDESSWRRFLRAELRMIKRHGAANLISNVVGVSAWAHQRFPRQRKDVAAIARRLGIESPSEPMDLERQAELLRLIANVITAPSAAPTLHDAGSSVADGLNGHAAGKRPWVERVGSFWRNLTGRT